MPERLQLKIFLPYNIFLDQPDVDSMVVETTAGAYGILPHRLDCAAALTPGILSYCVAGKVEQYVALAEGVLIKTGLTVQVSARHAVSGTDLSKLHELVEEEFRLAQAEEENMYATLIKLETGFMRRFTAFQQK